MLTQLAASGNGSSGGLDPAALAQVLPGAFIFLGGCLMCAGGQCLHSGMVQGADGLCWQRARRESTLLVP